MHLKASIKGEIKEKILQMCFVIPNPRVPTRIARELGIPSYNLADLETEKKKVSQALQRLVLVLGEKNIQWSDYQWLMYQQLCQEKEALLKAMWMFLPVTQSTDIIFET